MKSAQVPLPSQVNSVFFIFFYKKQIKTKRGCAALKQPFTMPQKCAKKKKLSKSQTPEGKTRVQSKVRQFETEMTLMEQMPTAGLSFRLSLCFKPGLVEREYAATDQSYVTYCTDKKIRTHIFVF